MEALDEAEVVVSEVADDNGSLRGWSYTPTSHRPEGGALVPKPISVGRREDVASGTGTVTTGVTGQPLEPPDGR